MNQSRSLYLAATALLLVATMASGQQSESVSLPDSHRTALARRFLSATGAANSADAMIAAFTKQMATALPEFHSVAWDSLGTHMHRQLPALQDSLAPLYAARFTVDELQGLIAFFESPLGRRFVTQQPALVEEASAVSQRWARGMTDEFTKAIKVRPVEKPDQ